MWIFKKSNETTKIIYCLKMCVLRGWSSAFLLMMTLCRHTIWCFGVMLCRDKWQNGLRIRDQQNNHIFHLSCCVWEVLVMRKSRHATVLMELISIFMGFRWFLSIYPYMDEMDLLLHTSKCKGNGYFGRILSVLWICSKFLCVHIFY